MLATSGDAAPRAIDGSRNSEATIVSTHIGQLKLCGRGIPAICRSIHRIAAQSMLEIRNIQLRALRRSTRSAM